MVCLQAETNAASRVEGAVGLRVSVVIATLNEAANLPHVFARIPEWVHEVVIVDGRSSDDTVVVAEALLPDVRIVLQDKGERATRLRAGSRPPPATSS